MHVSTARSWRGGENQVWLLARGLKERGHRVKVVAPPGTPLLERCAGAGIETHALNFCCEVDPIGVWRLAGVLRRERPDVLHLHDGHSVLPGQFAARLTPKGAVGVVAHRRTVFPLKGRWKYQGRVDRIVAISAAVRDRLVADGIEPGRVAVVFSGLDFGPLESSGAGRAEFRRKLGVADSELLVAYAGALTAEKRHRDMLAAVKRADEALKGRGHRGVHLALAGVGDQEQALRTEVREQGLEGQVHFLGFLKDVRPLWAGSDAAFFASDAEGLCTALVEAQGAGLPAVITRAGGMVEVTADGETGFVAGIGDVAALAAALAKLAEDPALRQRMGQAGAERVRRAFSADAMVAGVLGVYRQLTAGGAAK